MDYEDWMRASDYNNLRQALLNGHQHTGNDDGPQLNKYSFQAESIPRDRFQSRYKWLFAYPFICDSETGSEHIPSVSLFYNWFTNPFANSKPVDISAIFPYPRDIIGNTIDIYLHVCNLSHFEELISWDGNSIRVKVINEDSANLTSYDDPFARSVYVGQQLVHLVSLSPTPLSQPAILSVQVTNLELFSYGAIIYIDGVCIRYTGRP